MAVTESTYTGNGSTTNYSFTFPYLKTTDIKTSINGTATTAFTLANATTVQFNTAPANSAAIRIYRETDDSKLEAEFFAGSAIKSSDLNDNFNQNLYVTQESNNKIDAAWTTGDETITSTETWVSNDNRVSTTAAQDGRIDSKIDTALTTDVVGGQSITITDNSPGSGQITASVTAGSIRGTELAADAVDGTKIADDSINSEHYVDGSIDTAHIADLNVTTAKIAGDAITSTKIADDQINSEHYVAASIDTEHIADLQVTTAKIADSNITTAKIANDAITNGKIANNAVSTNEINTAAITTSHFSSGCVTNVVLGADSVNNAKIADNAIDSEHYVDGSVDHVHLANDCIDGDNIQDNAVNTEHIAANSVGDSEIATGALDNRYYTETESDARYFNISTGDTIKDGDTFPDNDTTIATTAAINDRIIDLVDDVGGFVPIANETSFPNANPDVNNGTGTLVSIKALASNLTSNGSGVATIANGTVGNSTVTITGLANSTTYASTFGMIVETTSTLNTYTFHRQVPKATEVTTVATNISNVVACGNNTTNINAAVSNASNINAAVANASNINSAVSNASNINSAVSNASNINAAVSNATNINTVAGANSNITSVAGSIANVNTAASNISDVNNFADLYQISTSAPSTDGGGNSLATGDLWFDSSSNKTLKVHNGTAFQAVSPSQSILQDIAIVSGQLTFAEDLGLIGDALSTGTGNNINTVATNIADVNTVAGISANVETVAGIHGNVTTVAGAVTNIATTVSNLANINNFAEVYRIASSAPSSSLNAGDLWYDAAGNVLKYYNGSNWTVTAAAGLSNIDEDTTPELGGHLDCNDKNLTEVGTVSGNNLQIDFGTI